MLERAVGIYCSNSGGQSGYITSLLFAASVPLAACKYFDQNYLYVQCD